MSVRLKYILYIASFLDIISSNLILEMTIKELTSKHVYLDNAATTRLDPIVLESMLPYMKGLYGNPSSTHPLGNIAKAGIEGVRRTITDILGGGQGHIFFTSSGTEANNWAICSTLEGNGIEHVITSPIEHVSVLEPLKVLERVGKVTCNYIALDSSGQVQYDSLIALLKKYPKALVSLMHGNNEVGNLIDLYRVGSICREYGRGAIFHTDMVQTLGNYVVNLEGLPVDICTGSAHKLHGPKGVGFVYIRDGVLLGSLLYGGVQERGLRAGTENVAGIIGLGKCLEVAYEGRDKNVAYLLALKRYMMQELGKKVSGILYNGLCAHDSNSLCTLLNIGLPIGVDQETLLLNLAIQGVFASSGSACMSGSKSWSHVLAELGIKEDRAVVRFSFSKYNSRKEIDYAVDRLATICKGQ